MITLLHVLKSEPDEITKKLIDSVSDNKDTKIYKLYEAEIDYEEFIELIFQCDKVFTW